ncbi:DUF1127 domain-containing protein [Mesorhizobium abyssinicae]|uniref:DUF1127 domain-containing protein n=1 Tax=Mesorhizobium abyssinicae TaxID=1209958 RepID=UPI0026A9F7ED
MFKTLRRLGAALKRASRHKETMRELNELPPETQKDIGWTESVQPHEIRLPF